MKSFFTKPFTMAIAGLFVLSAPAATAIPESSAHKIRTERGFEIVGHKGEQPSKGRTMPMLNTPAIKDKTELNAPRKTSSAANVIIDEDFSLWTEGSEEEPAYALDIAGFYIDPSNPWDINPDLTAQPGWAGSAIFEADGVCGHCYPNYGGYIQTPRTDYSGEVTITLRAKAKATEKSENLILIACFLKNNWDYGTPVASDSDARLTFPNDGEWHELSWTYNNTYGGSDCFIQFNSYYEMFIDDIRIESKTTFLPHPSALDASDFTIDGFTANWGEVAKATDYLLTCWRNVCTSVDNVEIDETFEDVNNKGGIIDMENPNLPQGWEFDFAGGIPSVFTTESGLESQALCLNADNQSITTPYTGSLITSAHVKMRYMSEPEIEIDEETGEVLWKDYYGRVYIDGWDGYKWKELFYNYFIEGDEDAFDTFDFTNEIAGKFYRLRLRTAQFSYGGGVEVALDDFHVTTLPSSEKDFACQDMSVEGTSYTFTGLDPESDYYYYVIANNSELGISSGDPVAGTFAFGVSAPVALEPTDINPEGSYTANWERTPKGQEYLVENLRIFTAGEDVECYTVLEESFQKCDIDATPEDPVSFGNMSFMSLDDFCDNKGWVGYLCGIAHNAIGGIGIPQFGHSGQIQTPFLSLGNNGGNYTVTVSAWGTPGDYLYVVNSAGIGAAIPLSDSFEGYEAEFTGGVDFDYLAFYSANARPFFIDYIDISQNLKKGDRVITIVDGIYTDQTSVGFNALEKTEENVTYGYTVSAKHTFLSNVAWSHRSDVVTVDFTNGVESISGNACQYVAGHKGCIEVSAPDNAKVEVFNAGGIRITGFSGGATVPASEGIYIVRINEKAFKVVVR